MPPFLLACLTQVSLANTPASAEASQVLMPVPRMADYPCHCPPSPLCHLNLAFSAEDTLHPVPIPQQAQLLLSPFVAPLWL